MSRQSVKKRILHGYGKIALVYVIAPFLCILLAVIAAEPLGVSAELGSGLGLVFVSLLLLLVIVVVWVHWASRQGQDHDQ